MKAKMKLDLGSIKNWLLAHGEKVAFAVVALVFVMFVYSALQRETVSADFEPTRLGELAGSVETHLNNSKWDPSREQLQVVSYANRAKTREVKLTDFPLPNPFNPPVADPKARRGVPEILPAEELRVAAGLDTFAIKTAPVAAAAGGNQAKQPPAQEPSAGDADKLQAKPWAVVTALVPVHKQQQAFDALFTGAVSYDPKSDTALYLKPVLERTEATAGDPNAAKWEPVADGKAFEEIWRGAAPEIVSPKFIAPDLTAKLGDLAQGTWDEAVSHPKVPLIGEEQPPAAPPADAPPGTKPAEPVIEHLLLRAFDYTVQPGKKYRYRVTLVAANPNAGKHPSYLKDPKSGQESTLKSPPSQPSSVVTIPDGHGVLAGAVEGGSRTREPTATIVVTSIDARTGLIAATEMKEVRRGTVGNTEQRAVKARNPLNKSIQDLDLAIKSNIMVLDISGGKPLGAKSKLTTPGEILLMDANGNLTVRSEMDDVEQYNIAMPVDPATVKPERALEKDDAKGKAPRKPIIGGR